MIVRPGIISDLPSVGSLWLLMMDEVYPGRKPDIKYWINFVSGLLRDCKEYALYVAEADGNVVGFTDFLIQYDPTFSSKVLNSFQTYVMPSYRNTGITKGLWSELVLSAKNNSCPNIFFSTAPSHYEYWRQGFGADLQEISMTIEVATLKEV
jgi:GNAT superfamily N-acetyltransferase